MNFVLAIIILFIIGLTHTISMDNIYIDETFGRTTSFNTLSIDEDYIVKAVDCVEQQAG